MTPGGPVRSGWFAVQGELPPGFWEHRGDRGTWSHVEASSVQQQDGDAPLPGATIAVRLERDGDRVVCTGLLVEADGELTSRALRAIPLGALSDELAHQVAEGLVGGEPAVAPIDEGVRTRGWADDRDFLTRVAAAYRVALHVRPASPMTWLAGQQGRSPSTVRRWVARARKLGLLDETPGIDDMAALLAAAMIRAGQDGDLPLVHIEGEGSTP